MYGRLEKPFIFTSPTIHTTEKSRLNWLNKMVLLKYIYAPLKVEVLIYCMLQAEESSCGPNLIFHDLFDRIKPQQDLLVR